MRRRSFLRLLAGAVAAAALPLPARPVWIGVDVAALDATGIWMVHADLHGRVLERTALVACSDGLYMTLEGRMMDLRAGDVVEVWLAKREEMRDG